MLNRVQLIGNVGHDLEVRSTPQGASVVSFNFATTRRYRDGGGERREATEWHRLVLWGKHAENAGRILVRGSLVYLEGRLETRSWDDEKTGVKQFRSEVIGRVWQVLAQPGSGGALERAPGAAAAGRGEAADGSVEGDSGAGAGHPAAVDSEASAGAAEGVSRV